MSKLDSGLTAPTWDEAIEQGNITHRDGHHDPNPDYNPRRVQRRSCGCEPQTSGGYAYRDVTVEMPDGRTVYFYHQSAVVVERDGQYRLDNHGYNTSTTKERINRYTPGEYFVRQRDFDWYVEGPHETVDFYNGIVIENGVPLPEADQ